VSWQVLGAGKWSALSVLSSMDPHLTTLHLVIAGNKTSGSARNTGSFFYYRTRYCRTQKLSVYLSLSTCIFAIWKLTSVILVSVSVSATYVNGHASSSTEDWSFRNYSKCFSASSCLLWPYVSAGLYYMNFIIYTFTVALLQAKNYFLLQWRIT
jgi:hypothetical protein